MKLYVESHFDATPDEVWAAFNSEAFHAALSKESGMSNRVLEEREENGIRHKKTEVKRSKDLPRIAAKVLGTKQLTYIQTDRYNPKTHTLEWEVAVPAIGDKFQVSGQTYVKATANGSRRVVDGDVSVRVRLVGGAVEKAIGGEFQKTAERAVEIARGLMK